VLAAAAVVPARHGVLGIARTRLPRLTASDGDGVVVHDDSRGAAVRLRAAVTEAFPPIHPVCRSGRV
jgi:hypothetical protein